MKRQSNHVRFVCFYVVCVRVHVCVCGCAWDCFPSYFSFDAKQGSSFRHSFDRFRFEDAQFEKALGLGSHPQCWNPRSGIAQSNGSSAIAHLNSCPFVRSPL